MTTRTVAAFDFDGTLTRRDSLVPFLASVRGWPRVTLALGAVAPGIIRDRDGAKERLLARLLAGLRFEEVAAAGHSYGARLARDGIRPSARARLAWHRREGHEIVIVSASLDVYLDEVARALAVDAVLCTALEVDGAGRCTGRLRDGNCRGAAKARRLRAHLGDGDVVLWAYGDSAGDREMLAMADHGVRVGRRALAP